MRLRRILRSIHGLRMVRPRMTNHARGEKEDHSAACRLLFLFAPGDSEFLLAPGDSRSASRPPGGDLLRASTGFRYCPV